MALRFAAGLPAIARALKQIFPAPKNAMDYGSYAIRYVPELLGAGAVAASLPGEDVDAGTRLLAGGEELATSLGLSLLGSLGGRTVARSVMKNRVKAGKNSPLPDGTTRQQAYKQGIDMGVNLGDAAALPLQFLMPRAFYNSQIDQYMNGEESATEQTEASADQTDVAIAALLASGALGSAGMTALGSGQPRMMVGGRYAE
jgi:hypothetical protein